MNTEKNIQQLNIKSQKKPVSKSENKNEGIQQMPSNKEEDNNQACDKKEELPQFCVTRHGNSMMLLSQYRYTRRNIYSEGQTNRWVCTSQGHKKCKAVIFTVNNIVTEAHTKHTHPPARLDSSK